MRQSRGRRPRGWASSRLHAPTPTGCGRELGELLAGAIEFFGVWQPPAVGHALPTCSGFLLVIDALDVEGTCPSGHTVGSRCDTAIAQQAGFTWLASFPDHICHRCRYHLGLAVLRRCSQSDDCKLVAAAWVVGTANRKRCKDQSRRAIDRYSFTRTATACTRACLDAPKHGPARRPTRGWSAANCRRTSRKLFVSSQRLFQ